VRRAIDEAGLLGAYLRELGHWAQLAPGRTVSSIFFGGGTPSLMQPATVAALITAVADHWPIAAGAEITLEANPSSVEAGRFRDYRGAGVNRVSLGVQSLSDAALRALGRLHTAEEARGAIRIARQTFARVSFDLIYARPGQGARAWREELSSALALAPRHLSLYQLTIEPATPFAELHARGKLTLPRGAVARQCYALTQELTERAGLPAYEVSNHAASGEACRHNLLYWRYGEYVGVGPGAHGRVVVAGERLSTKAEPRPEAWADRVAVAGHGLIEASPLTAEQQADEALLMGLRLTEGVDLKRLAAMSGLAPARRALATLTARGLIASCGHERVRATAEGRLVLNTVILELASALEPVAVVGRTPPRPFPHAFRRTFSCT
jgi:oxygen-independent coproporphyrinogen-3 oxidase